MPVLHLLAAFLGSSYRSIDVSLMHLQRREQLFRALTHSALGDADQRKQAWQALKADTDRRWQQIWRSRPVS
jgi:hypothetical protein